MGIFKRLFSADYRAALAAEAAGDLDLAAERYALCGQLESAVRIHLARAERARSRAEEIDALRDALHWAPREGEWRHKASVRLGNALLAQVRAEGVATDRDKERVRNAAGLLEDAGEFAVAAQAYESIGDDNAAARAFEKGGQVEKMEAVLERLERQSDEVRALRQTFADYELAYLGGERFRARDLLRRCVELAEHKGEYRQLLDELESKLVSAGRIVLELRKTLRLTCASAPSIRLGRDPRCELTLRSQGVSREHAVLQREDKGYSLTDLHSRNGTLVGGLPFDGALPLHDTGSFQLGPECKANYAIDAGRLTLSFESGLDQSSRLLCAPDNQAIDLEAHGVLAQLTFRDGRPVLSSTRSELQLGGKRLAQASIELIRGDVLSVAGVELEVLE